MTPSPPAARPPQDVRVIRQSAKAILERIETLEATHEAKVAELRELQEAGWRVVETWTLKNENDHRDAVLTLEELLAASSEEPGA